ncbi:unnamed protein product, partial [Prorocentrum cordatum]
QAGSSWPSLVRGSRIPDLPRRVSPTEANGGTARRAPWPRRGAPAPLGGPMARRRRRRRWPRWSGQPGAALCALAVALGMRLRAELAAAALTCLPRRAARGAWPVARGARPHSRRAAAAAAAGCRGRPRATSAIRWLMSEDDASFLGGCFGARWRLRRWACPRVAFGVGCCLGLLSELGLPSGGGPQPTGGSGQTPSPSRFKSAMMLRTLASGSEQVVDQAEVADFVRQRRLETPEDLTLRGDGWTFIVNLVNSATPEMQGLHHALWAGFGLGGGFNAYLTPPGAQGLAPHVDKHDVFVLQQSGQKEWHLLDEATWSERHTVTLTAGDVLYLPAGVPHYARSAGGEPSLHLSAGVHRSHLSAAGILAAWLELGDGAVPALTPKVADDIAFWTRRLAARGGPWGGAGQLLASPLS